MAEAHEPTRRGGVRRIGVAQSSESAAATWRRSVGRIHPPVLKWAERLGLPECPYLIRWRIETPLGSVRVHHWLGSDDDRAFHDHPWWFLTFVFRGGYDDHNPINIDRVVSPAVRFRKAHHQHTVHPHVGGAWTFMITGPKIRAWGFWHAGKFIKANKWFLKYGHHPCAEGGS